jgi:hypothetical protein
MLETLDLWSVEVATDMDREDHGIAAQRLSITAKRIKD